ncbi:MAG: hypothetical protein H6579_11015 [Chitinophagales bacterium]|nr:hypothetical protein [Chitinophagales bacterium]
MVLRIITFFNCLLLACLVNAQASLAYTDAYGSNLFKDTENSVVFQNNTWVLLDSLGKEELLEIMNSYFSEIELPVYSKSSESPIQLVFTYEKSSQDLFLSWSNIWHQKYERKVLELALKYLKMQSTKHRDIFANLQEAALYKFTLNEYIKSQDSNNYFFKTNLNLSSKDLDVAKFLKVNLSPNLSLKRAITNSTSNQYKEAFELENFAGVLHFNLGPKSSSRLVDCFSMHVFCKLNGLDAPIYFNNFSIFTYPDRMDFVLSNELDMSLLMQVENEILNLANNPIACFYNIADKEALASLRESYTAMDLQRFYEVFVQNRLDNTVFGEDSARLAFQLGNLSDSIFFKVNTEKFLSEQDSLKLDRIALFLINNSSRNLVLFGQAKKSEYTKVDKAKFLALIDKYKEYTPVKYSRRMDLSLYRSLLVFDYLVGKGVDPKSMTCMAKLTKEGEMQIPYLIFKFKLK